MNEKEEYFEKLILAKMQVTEQGVQQEIERIETLAKKIGMDIEIKNVASIAIEKITNEIIPAIKNAGVHLNEKSIIVRAATNSISEQVAKARKVLKQYEKAIAPEKALDEKEENQIALKKSSVTRRLIELVKRTFGGLKGRKTAITRESLDAANMYMAEYEDINEQIEQYSIQEDIIDEIVAVICPNNGLRIFAREVPEIIYEQISPILMNLGLGRLIPQLEERITAAYLAAEADKLRDCSSEERYIYIPDFEGYIQKQIIEPNMRNMSIELQEPQAINCLEVEEENGDSER